VVTGQRQSIQTLQEIKQDAGHCISDVRVDVAYSKLSIRTDSIQFGRPFRRHAADVGVTGLPGFNRWIPKGANYRDQRADLAANLRRA
jgi:hypothetical protein